MALRTERGVQPRWRAIPLGDWPLALANRIWQRRRVKAWADRSPSWRRWRSRGVRVRTKVVTGLMQHSSHLGALWKDLAGASTSAADARVPRSGVIGKRRGGGTRRAYSGSASPAPTERV